VSTVVRSWFTEVLNSVHGNCFIFNSGWNNTDTLTSHRTGRRFGMSVTVSVTQSIKQLQRMHKALSVDVMQSSPELLTREWFTAWGSNPQIRMVSPLFMSTGDFS